MNGYYTIPEFFAEYPMSKATMYRFVKRGQLRITKFGRANRIAKADAKAWADSLPVSIGSNEAQG